MLNLFFVASLGIKKNYLLPGIWCEHDHLSMTRSSMFLFQLHVILLKAILWFFLNFRGVMIYFASWGSMSEIYTPNRGISMFGRDAHMIDLIVKHLLFAILHVIIFDPLSTTLFSRERVCICESIYPGPSFSIRTQLHFLCCTLLCFSCIFFLDLISPSLASHRSHHHHHHLHLHFYFLFIIWNCILHPSLLASQK